MSGAVEQLFLALVGRPPLNRLYRKAVAWRFRRFERARGGRPVLESVAGYPIVVLPDVLNPRLFYSGAFLARALSASLVRPGARVLDMGTGSGIIAVAAAHLGAHVVAVDINPAAARSARINALLNHVETTIDVRTGDLFEAVANERFDVVIFNPPYLAGKPRSLFEHALYGPGVIGRFGANLAAHLYPGGNALLLLSSLADEAGLLRTLRELGWRIEIEAARQLPLERLTLYRLARPEPDVPARATGRNRT